MVKPQLLTFFLFLPWVDPFPKHKSHSYLGSEKLLWAGKCGNLISIQILIFVQLTFHFYVS